MARRARVTRKATNHVSEVENYFNNKTTDVEQQMQQAQQSEPLTEKTSSALPTPDDHYVVYKQKGVFVVEKNGRVLYTSPRADLAENFVQQRKHVAVRHTYKN